MSEDLAGKTPGVGLFNLGAPNPRLVGRKLRSSASLV